MAWPTVPVTTTNTDADTDSPLVARPNLLDALQKLNQIIAHVTTYTATLFAQVDAPGWRSLLGLGSAAVEPVTTFWSTGDCKLTLKTAADAGWVLFNDGTIGNAASGGTTRANADTAALFTLLWTNTANAQCAVSGGRGGSAAADFAANKTIALPKALGRALAVYGTGAGLSARVLAEILGTETHTLTQAQTPLKDHAHSGSTDAVQGPESGGGHQMSTGGPNNDFLPANITVTATGDSTADAHPIMQPTLFLNVMVKL